MYQTMPNDSDAVKISRTKRAIVDSPIERLNQRSCTPILGDCKQVMA
jgi:hypothetical protein